jgi:hypothetical protein
MPYANFPYLMEENHFEELFHYDYGREFLNICKQFQPYGIQKEDISVISPKDSVEFVLDKMKRIGILLLDGGNPDSIVKYMPQEVWEEMDNMEILIGVSAGAMVQASIYYMMKGYQDDSVPLVKQDRLSFGMCYLFNAVVPHYDENDKILRKGVERYRGKHFDDLILLEDGQGIIYEDCEMIGFFEKEEYND